MAGGLPEQSLPAVVSVKLIFHCKIRISYGFYLLSDLIVTSVVFSLPLHLQLLLRLLILLLNNTSTGRYLSATVVPVV